MKTLVSIPSYNRPYDIDKRTGFWLKQLDRFDYRVFVEPSQSIYYEQTFDSKNLVETNDNNGLYGQMIDIGHYAIEKGYDLVTKIDDDTYYTDVKRKKTKAHLVIQDGLDEIKQRFKDNPKLGIVGFASGMDFFYNKGNGFKTRKKATYGTLVVRPEILINLNREYHTFNDLMISVVCKGMGYDIETYYNICENRIMETNSGGLQSLDRKALAKETSELIKRDYPKAIIIPEDESKYGFVDIDMNKYFK